MCLGHVARLIHQCATVRPGGDFSEIRGLGRDHWRPLDMSSVPSESIPDHDTSEAWKFSGIGAWGSGNVSGSIELLTHRGRFVQVGVQTLITPTLIFGSKRAFRNSLWDLSHAAAHCYAGEPPMPTITDSGTVTEFGDQSTVAYIGTSRQGKAPVLTLESREPGVLVAPFHTPSNSPLQADVKRQRSQSFVASASPPLRSNTVPSASRG